MAEIVFVGIVGLTIFVLLVLGVIFISSATFRKVNNVEKYCNKRFDQITKLINETNDNTSSLTKLVKELNDNIKN